MVWMPVVTLDSNLEGENNSLPCYFVFVFPQDFLTSEIKLLKPFCNPVFLPLSFSMNLLTYQSIDIQTARRLWQKTSKLLNNDCTYFKNKTLDIFTEISTTDLLLMSGKSKVFKNCSEEKNYFFHSISMFTKSATPRFQNLSDCLNSSQLLDIEVAIAAIFL